eukprot:GFYU01016114.1.p1 GENE.GFYU01016114.1~~GFYU01016114.1.p1  ORF type:complete len:250 (-),score=62.05 GFYU01016114.1:130-801(-)
MLARYTLVGVLALLGLSSNPAQAFKARPNELKALKEIYLGCNGDNWEDQTGWNEEHSDACENLWGGVTCEDRHVIRLNLGGSQLECEVNYLLEKLQEMRHLEFVNVGYNLLTGEPAFKLDMPDLTVLHMAHNELEGSLPDLSGCPHLHTVSLSHNEFSGSIPESYSADNMPELNMVMMNNNKLGGDLLPFMEHVDWSIVDLRDNDWNCPVPDWNIAEATGCQD